MAINKNHEFEELNGIKCGIVEKNISVERVQFLKDLLEHNGFIVITAVAPQQKVAAPNTTQEGENETQESKAPAPETFTLGVSDYTFNATNAIFGRTLKTKTGTVVTLAYWKQKESISNYEVPYFENGK